MAEEVHPSTSTSKEVGKPGVAAKGGKFQKYKWWIIGGAIIILLLLFFMLRSKSSSSSQQAANDAATAAQQQSGIDPETGYEYGSAADLAALGASSSSAGTPGPAGATGATGTTGAAGPAGPAGPAASIPWTLAQEEKAWNPKRSKAEQGSLYIGGKWFSGVPKPPAKK